MLRIHVRIVQTNPCKSNLKLPSLFRTWEDPSKTLEQLWNEGAATHVSKVTEEMDSPDDVAPEISEHDEAMLHASAKKSARQKTREESGRNRRRGGLQRQYYQRWAFEPDPQRRKFQSM